jgi:hypothetical protein
VKIFECNDVHDFLFCFLILGFNPPPCMNRNLVIPALRTVIGYNLSVW